MTSVQDIATEIVAREGGYVNDPDDPGGATNHGVTIHTMRRLGLDLTGDGAVTVADVRRLTRADAIRIFIEHYYIRPGLDRLPHVLQASVLRQMGQDVTVDGVLGPLTAAAAQAVARAAPGHIGDAYGIARRNYYFRLADSRPASRKFARSRAGGKGGWITRAEEFISPRFHLSDADFQERVAQWA